MFDDTRGVFAKATESPIRLLSIFFHRPRDCRGSLDWFKYPNRIRMYGRLMLTKLGFLLMVNVDPYMAYMDPMGYTTIMVSSHPP